MRRLALSVATAVVTVSFLPASARALEVPIGSGTDITAAADGASSVAAGDFDGDGDLDLASASSNDDTIALYDNTGGGAWTGTDIATSADGARSVATGDLDGDGDLDLASASSNDDTIAWYENTNGDASAWTATDIAVDANGAVWVAVGDLDGDGDLDLASASTDDDAIAWYENTNGDASAWTATDIYTGDDTPTSVAIGDLDGDGDLDLVSVAISQGRLTWHENTNGDAGAWSSTTLASPGGVDGVALGDIDHDGDIDIVSASTNDTIAWYDNTAGDASAWTARTIATSADVAISVATGDFDGDGDLDIASASYGDHTIAWYENEGGAPLTWTARDIATNATNAQSAIFADLDRDGDLDIASASSGDDTVAWYENDAIHSTTRFTTAAEVATSADTPYSTATGDLDGDGDLDLASASLSDDTIAWYENTNGDASAWTATDIATNATDAITLAVGDLDGDGDPDIAAGAGSAIVWYGNTNGDASAWTPTTVSNTPSGTTDVEVADIDGDGDLDLASASYSDDTIAWYENTNGDASAWTATDISTTALGARSVAIGDLDHDGDLDLASASTLDNKIAWYENDNGDASAWTATSIATSAASANSVAIGDLDHDGDLDLASASGADDTIAWYENLAGNAGTWTATDVATNADGAFSVAIGDLDRDGDVDLASGSMSDDTVAWYENMNGNAGTWTPTDVATTADGATSVVLGDLDRDGDVDLVSSSYADDTIAWYENVRTQVGAAATNQSPANVTSGAVEDVLRLALSHRGRSDDRAAAITNIGLRFEQGPGDPLTQAETEALVAQVRLYLDDGDNTLDDGDTLIASYATSALTIDGAGESTVTVPDVASATVPYGTPRTYLVALRFTPNATLVSPNTVRVTYLPTALAVVDDTAPAIALAVDAGTSVTSSTVTAQNSAPVADAGGPYTVETGGTITLDGTQSSDADQTATTLTYAWDFDDDGQYDDATGSQPAFGATGVNAGARTVGLRVTDAAAAAATDTATVTVTAAPSRPVPAPIGARGPIDPATGEVRDGTVPAGTSAVGAVRTGDGDGQWIAADDGGVFTSGSASFCGSMGGAPLNDAIVGISVTTSEHGYWLVASDGGLFAFGDAQYYGSLGHLKLNQPIIGIAPTPTGHGYWLVASDGGVFAFGDAQFHGSLASDTGTHAIVGLWPAPDGNGYRLISNDATIHRFGSA